MITLKANLQAAERYTKKRKNSNSIVKIILFAATTITVIILCILLLNVVNNAFGTVAVMNEIQPETLTDIGVALEEMDTAQLLAVIEKNLSRGLVRRFNDEEPMKNRSIDNLMEIIDERIINSKVMKSWSMVDTVFRKESIRDYFVENPDQQRLFRAWIRPEFLVNSQSSTPENAGVRTAILGSLWIILITFIFAFPIGIGTAVYMEEYAVKNRLHKIIQTNIYNLAGVPSIIYGLLGLAVFVRVLEPITSGAMFGLSDSATANGRTVLSAGLTLGLLVLPIIIINAQEALRALPDSLRNSSLGLGATKWQTIRYHLLPNAFERILTGTIMALSRAIGETAPLIVVGASTFVSIDPSSPFSKFTTLPIQIYQWSARPQGEFRNIAAAAIIVLLVLLLGMNSFAIYFRNHYAKKRNY